MNKNSTEKQIAPHRRRRNRIDNCRQFERCTFIPTNSPLTIAVLTKTQANTKLWREKSHEVDMVFVDGVLVKSRFTSLPLKPIRVNFLYGDSA